MSDQNPLIAWLGGFTGNLQVLSQEDEKNKNELVQFLKSSIPSSIEFSQAKNSPFVFEKLSPSTFKDLSPELQQQISDVVSDENIALLQKEFKVFQRETPVRNVNALRSTPLWAAGAAVAKTIGPFLNIDGRRVWFDFFSVEKLVALYIQGAANPAIIFNVNVAKTWTGENTALLAPDTQNYKLTANSSIWINSEILAPDAPTGKYTGLTISSGTIDLSTMPVINGDKTTIPSGTLVTVKLKLAQQKVTDADDTSPYGADARAAEYTLPDVLEFQFNNSGSTITNISGAKWKIFDQPCSFKWNNTKGNYNADLFSLFIPFTSSEANFIVNKSLSPFAQFSGTSKIIASYWNLPAADLDLAHISPAAGIGALAILCDKGISTSWSGLQNGDININSCFIIAHPEGIAIGTTVAGNLYSKQNFSLWKDEKNPYESKLKIEFGKQFPLRFFSTVNGYEIIEATVNTIVEADRPIDVSAKPLPVRTKGSLLALFAYKNHRTIILYDNNLIQDNLTADIKDFLDLPVTSIALRNALFTTSTVMGCFLTADVSPDWKKVESGNLYLSLGIYKYIPMLPDPYAANVSVFQQFKDYRVTDKVQLHIPVMLLLCQVKWGVRGEGLPDHVTTSFHLLPFSTDQNNNQLITLPAASDNQNNDTAFNTDLSNAMVVSNNQISDWSKAIDNYFRDLFALLDVSSHANQMGVSFGQLNGERGPSLLFREFGVETQNEQMQSLYSVPFKIEEVQVMSPSIFVRSFTLPQIAWEPVHNLTDATYCRRSTERHEFLS